MIKKEFRLKENEVKKVLSKWKPFFSYWVVLNKIPTKLSHSRFAIILWSKSVNNNITRNYFRRRFYDHILNSKIYNNNICFDFVFVVKSKLKLDIKDINTINNFIKDIDFLINKSVTVN